MCKSFNIFSYWANVGPGKAQTHRFSTNVFGRATDRYCDTLIEQSLVIYSLMNTALVRISLYHVSN